MKRHYLKKSMAILLAFVMILYLLPVSVLAEEGADGNSTSYLSSLAFSPDRGGYASYPIEPAFQKDTMNYTITVPDYTDTIYSRATVVNEGDNILATYPNSWGGSNGVSQTPGMWTQFTFLSTGSTGMQFNIHVAPKPTIISTSDTIYNITAVRRVSLKGLAVNETLCPDFDKDTLNYTVGVASDADTVGITATAYQSDYTLTVNGVTATSGSEANITPVWDENGKMEVPIVVSCDGGVSTTYTLTLIRETAGDTPLLSVQPQNATYLDTVTNPEALTVRAVANSTLSYQWYGNTTNSTENGTPITDATASSYIPTITNVGTEAKTTYYYCVVTNTKDSTPYTTTSNTAAITVKPDPTPTVTIITEDGSGIPEEGYSYNTGDNIAITLKAKAETRAAGGTWAYGWCYRVGETGYRMVWREQTYTPQTLADKASVYFCKVSYVLDGVVYSVNSINDVSVKVTANSAQAPAISNQPESAEYLIGTSGVSDLKVNASITDSGKLTYQWYSSTDNKSFTAIDGAASASYTPPTLNEETSVYYYCSITNTVNSCNGNIYTAEIKSNTATVSFKTAANLGCTFQGEGTVISPYLVQNQDELIKLRDMVNTQGISFENYFFKLTTDITLPNEWVPIGALKPGQTGAGSGKNIRPFSGNIDGGSKTITVPEGELPLLGYVRNASVKDLNISGIKIAGYGLVNNYTVDYGPTGSYGSSKVDTISIDNVTLKSGSSTKKSGFIGGFASGINIIKIKNSVIENNVIIGYDKDQSCIGSFAGDFNGIMENCVSYATVYGKNYVGGLVGIKGQSMGPCIVRESAFHGTVEASGNYAGGIMGSGYSSGSAPNTPCVTIQNCYSNGSVTGTDYVGGLLGGEPACKQCWANGIGYIQNNYFTGTVAATADNAQYIGGIIGFMKSLDRYNVISNNYYLESCGAAKGIGAVEAVDIIDTNRYNRTDDPTGVDSERLAKSVAAAKFSDGTVLAALNSGINSSGNWIQGENYPVSGTSVHLVTFTVSGYDSRYEGGASLDLGALTITALYSDGTAKAIDASHVTFTGFDNTTKGYKTVTAIYGKHIFIFEILITSDVVPSSDTIMVYFSLLGDSVHDSDKDGVVHTLKSGNLQTWIASEAYTVSCDARVIDVFAAALSKYRYTWYNQDKLNDTNSNYIQSVSTPDGIKLGEFTNGKYSGWMYTLNGTHPTIGVAEQSLSEGNVIVFHYTDDYRAEEGSDKWDDESGNTSSENTATGSAVISPEATAKDELAAVSVGISELADAIRNTGRVKNAEIAIAPKIKGTVRKLTVDLTKSSIASVASETNADLTVKSSICNVTIPNKTLSSIEDLAKGSTVTISLNNVDKASLNAEQQTAAGINKVYDISIISNDKHISGFDGSVKVSLPYTLRDGEAADSVIVWYLNDTGNLEKMNCTYDKTTGLASFTTTHLSYYVVGSEAWTNPFSDVKSTDWYYEAMKYVVKNGLFSGTSGTAFEPDACMTRAMLVTVLYRMEGKPAVSGSNSFTDVKDGEWYTNAVKWADKNNIVSGYSSSLFGTNDNITREQMAAVLYNYAKYKNYDVVNTADLKAYTDASGISTWAETAIKWAVYEKLFTGTTATTLSLSSSASRAQVAVMFMRFCGNTKYMVK